MFQTCILGNNSCQEFFFPLLKKRWGTRSSFLSLCKMSHDKSQPNADFPPYQMNYFLAEKNATRFCFFSDACIKKCEAKNPLNPTISLGIFCTNSPWHFPCKISQWKKSEHVYWHKIFTFFFLFLSDARGASFFMGVVSRILRLFSAVGFDFWHGVPITFRDLKITIALLSLWVISNCILLKVQWGKGWRRWSCLACKSDFGKKSCFSWDIQYAIIQSE